MMIKAIFYISDFIRRNFKDLIEVFSVNLLGLAASVRIEPILESFNLANEVFRETEAIWKALPLLATFIYTIIKIIKEIRNAK